MDTMEMMRADRDALCEQAHSLALALSDPEMQLPREAAARANLEQIERAVLASLAALEHALRAN